MRFSKSQHIAAFVPHMASVHDMLSQAQINIEESIHETIQLAETIEQNPERLHG